MSKARTWIILTVALLCSATAVLWQHQENGRLAQALTVAHEENARLEASQANTLPPSVKDDEPKTVQELEAEIVRLRGVAARTARAEAEVTQLKAELARSSAHKPNASPEPVSPNSEPLAQYLGTAMAPPANLAPAYTKQGLLDAVKTAADKAGVSLKQVQVDESEFPYLVGVVSAPGDWEKLKEQLRKLEGYEYFGAVGNATRNAFNITPFRTLPSDSGNFMHRRINLRMQVFYDQIKE